MCVFVYCERHAKQKKSDITTSGRGVAGFVIDANTKLRLLLPGQAYSAALLPSRCASVSQLKPFLFFELRVSTRLFSFSGNAQREDFTRRLLVGPRVLSVKSWNLRLLSFYCYSVFAF